MQTDDSGACENADSDSVVPGSGLRICIFNKLPVDSGVAGSQAALGVARK